MGEQISYCKKVKENTVKKQFNIIKNVLDEGVENNYIFKEFARQLLPPKPKSGAFYLLPKVHKEYVRIPKGRPIIPGCGSKYRKDILFLWSDGKRICKEARLLHRRHSDLLRYFKQLNETDAIPENCKPISLDLTSMYTNIPIEEGIEAFRIELET